MKQHIEYTQTPFEGESAVKTRFWHEIPGKHPGENKIQCDLCPRACQVKEGKRGLCFIRANHENGIVLTSYGRSSGFVIDPIEKKPLNHFYPGSSILSFGTAGCNLSCKFCQNWDISKSREMDSLMDQASPEQIAARAVQSGCKSVAYTYNDPVIFYEYAIDTAIACKEKGILSVAVTAGYICPEPRIEFFSHMDAANVDLKGFSEDFYYKLTGSHLQPVLETLEYLYHETDVWFEITTLLIPGKNDSDEEIRAMSEWIREHLGVEVPVHFTAFHPDYKMMDIPPTPKSTLLRARDIALKEGLLYVYAGNVHDKTSGSTWCPNCGQCLIGRDWYVLSDWNLTEDGKCNQCGTTCHGHFEAKPGHWGPKRERIFF